MMDKYEVSNELAHIKNLLNLMGDVFEIIQEQDVKYRKRERESDKHLAYAAHRNIDQLVTLQDVLSDKVLELEKNFKE